MNEADPPPERVDLSMWNDKLNFMQSEPVAEKGRYVAKKKEDTNDRFSFFLRFLFFLKYIYGGFALLVLLIFVLVTAPKTHKATLEEEPAYFSVFIHQDKCASSTMREYLSHLDSVCYIKKTMRCENSPKHTVIVGADFGFCEFASQKRSCRYFTTMRDPLDRIISSYNYFCLDCRENGKFCAKERDNLGWGCPRNFSFTEWVDKFPNQFVRRFGRNWYALKQEGSGYYHEYLHGFENLDVISDAEYDKTLNLLRDPKKMFIVWIDQMNSSSVFKDLSQYIFGFPDAFAVNGTLQKNDNSNHPDMYGKVTKNYLPSIDEVHHFESVNALQIDLVKKLRHVSESVS